MRVLPPVLPSLRDLVPFLCCLTPGLRPGLLSAAPPGLGCRHYGLGAEEVPRFAVGVVEAGFGVAFAAEEEAGDSAGGGEGEDVPGVLGDDVGGEEIDFGGEIGDGASVDAAVGVGAVETFEQLGGTFHLHAPEERWSGGRAGGGGLFWSWSLLRIFLIGLRPTGILLPRDGWQVKGGGQECPPHMECPAHMEVAGVEDEVVAFAVSVGLGDGEAEADGFEDEREFGELSATLGGEVVAGGGIGGWGDGPWARRWRASGSRALSGHLGKRKGAGFWPAPLFLLYISRIAFWEG